MRTARTVAAVTLLLFACTSRIHAQAQEDQDFATCVERFRNITPDRNGLPSIVDENEAQELSAEFKAGREKQGRQLPLGSSEAAPPPATELPAVEVSIFAGEKDGRGLLSYSRNVAPDSSLGSVSDLSIKVSVPFNQSEGQAVFASLGGLSGDIVLSVALSGFVWDLAPQKYGDALCRECKDHGVPLLECSLEGLERRGVGEAARKKIHEALFGQVTSKSWGFEGSIGRKERSFFEPDAVEKEEDRPGYTLALLGGLVFSQGSLYGRITGKRDYKEMESATKCSPITGSVLEDCTTLSLGEAQEVESLIATLEARYFSQTFAVAPSVQYDFESDVWGLQAPVFLVRNENGAFTGGIKLGWRSDQNDLIATIFVAKGFALAP